MIQMDGTIDTDNNEIEFSTTEKQLDLPRRRK